MKKRVLILLAAAIAGAAQTYTSSESNLQMRRWFQDAKFGLFVHWGVYSVLGDGEWVMNNQKIPISEYEKLTSFDPARPERNWIHPKYYFRLAELYEKNGMKEGAIEKYKRFLDLWKNADPEIAEVVEAKKRLAALQG